MGDDIISMENMLAIFEVTDRFGIDREQISVPLEKAGTGTVTRQPGGGLEITVPAAVPAREWLSALQAEIERLGFKAQGDNDE